MTSRVSDDFLDQNRQYRLQSIKDVTTCVVYTLFFLVLQSAIRFVNIASKVELDYRLLAMQNESGLEQNMGQTQNKILNVFQGILVLVQALNILTDNFTWASLVH